MKTEIKKLTKNDFRKATAASIGTFFDEATFGRAWGKAVRWMNAAYGSADLQTFADECGLDIGFYYTEAVSSNKSFNRAAFSPKSSC